MKISWWARLFVQRQKTGFSSDSCSIGFLGVASKVSGAPCAPTNNQVIVIFAIMSQNLVSVHLIHRVCPNLFLSSSLLEKLTLACLHHFQSIHRAKKNKVGNLLPVISWRNIDKLISSLLKSSAKESPACRHSRLPFLPVVCNYETRKLRNDLFTIYFFIP